MVARLFRLNEAHGAKVHGSYENTLKTDCLERINAISPWALKDRAIRFTEKFYAVYHLHTLAQSCPELFDDEAVASLQRLLKDAGLVQMRQSLFLFREAADTLSALVAQYDRPGAVGGARKAYAALLDVLGSTRGHAHRAAAEAFCGLPLDIKGPQIDLPAASGIACLKWDQVLAKAGLGQSASCAFYGRSLVSAVKGKNRLLVVKLARSADVLQSLLNEVAWMAHLGPLAAGLPLRFDVPRPLYFQDSPLFRLKDLPLKPTKINDVHSDWHAIAFMAAVDYFHYPNDVRPERRPDHNAFIEIISRNAFLLGHLASQGIIHEAPIPLFHNRVQRHRRRDGGLYEWFRAGRLDRWLASCTFPNIGFSGLRDFEHLHAFAGSNRQLYRYIGNHLLSLFLVVGRYFRNQSPDRVGRDGAGNPVDVRDLFDRRLLIRMNRVVIDHYYRGFTGVDANSDLPIDLRYLAARMIQEMGVDHHMEEVLRIADQNQMTSDAYVDFLIHRGFCPDQIDRQSKGQAEIVVQSGPHLGAFNDRISLPELIEAVETGAACCLAGRFFNADPGCA